MTTNEILLAVSWGGCMVTAGGAGFIAGMLVGGRNLAAGIAGAAAPIISAVKARAGA